MELFESTDSATFRSQDQSPSGGRIARLRSREVVEVAIVFALILVALWSGHALQRLLGCLTFFWIIVSTLRAQHDASSLGLQLSGLRRSLWIVYAALLSAALVIWVASRMHTLHLVFRGVSVGSSILAYMLWALVQQFIMQDFFLLRMLRILPTRTAAIVATASLFAVVHLPNPLLTVVTLVWGVAACALFLRYRNLYSLGATHAILGICLAIAVPNTVHHQMRVGVGYLHWHAPAPPVHRSQIDQTVSTDAWVMADATSRRSARHALP